MPTTPAKGVQGIITRCDPERRMGWALVIDEQQRLALWLGDGAGHLVQTAAPERLKAGLWYSAGASYDGATGAHDCAPGTGAQRRQFAGRAGRDASAGVHARGDRRAGQLPLAIGGCDRRMGGRYGCFRRHNRWRPLQRQNRSLARRAVESGARVAVVTGDKDFFQLVDDHVRVFNPRDEGTWYDADGVKAENAASSRSRSWTCWR